MISEQKILLIMPSLEKPKKNTNVESMRPCLMNSARLLYFFAWAPNTIGKPLQILIKLLGDLLVYKSFIHFSIGHECVNILVPPGCFPLKPN